MEHILTRYLLCLFAFLVTVTDGQDKVCFRPVLADSIDLDGLQRYFNPGEELALACKQGYTPVSGPRKIVCTSNGEWTKTKLLCIPKLCPFPDPLINGELHYEDTAYKSTINYTCNEGYTLTGASTAECLATRTWSTPVPECKPVQCGLAPIPKFGIIIYDRQVRGNTTRYNVQGTYKCLPPYALIGEARAKCTASGTWTKTPECQVVTCPPPENIDRGYMSSNDQRTYGYMETISYGCYGDFTIEGSYQIFCQQNGNWSEKPSCKAPCSVGIQRTRILYNGRKIWMNDFKPNRVSHNEIVSVYCVDKDRNCSYAVPTQCLNGNLEIPECFEEPIFFHYLAQRSSLSETEPC